MGALPPTPPLLLVLLGRQGRHRSTSPETLPVVVVAVVAAVVVVPLPPWRRQALARLHLPLLFTQRMPSPPQRLSLHSPA